MVTSQGLKVGTLQKVRERVSAAWPAKTSRQHFPATGIGLSGWLRPLQSGSTFQLNSSAGFHCHFFPLTFLGAAPKPFSGTAAAEAAEAALAGSGAT